MTPQPLLKWPGGKRGLLPLLLDTAETLLPDGLVRYHEPFVGGGALFFALAQHDLSKRARLGSCFGERWAHLADASPDVIGCYLGVQADPARVTEALGFIVADHRRFAGPEHDMETARGHYARCREQFCAMQAARGHVATPRPGFAAAMLFLNHACFNGVWRTNSKGLFNVHIGKPSGDRGHSFPSAEHIAVASAVLSCASLRCGDFAPFIEQVGPGDLVFLDPPYSGVEGGGVGAFKYGGSFTPDHQRWLAFLAQRCLQRGAAVMLTNGDYPGNRTLYEQAGLTVIETSERRAVNSKTSGRGKVPCLLAYGSGA